MLRRSSPGWALLLSAAIAGPAGAGAEDGHVERLSHAYLERWLSESPTVATALGMHRSDRRLPPLTHEGLADRIAWTRAEEAEVRSIPADQLSPSHALEREALAFRLGQDALDLGTIRRFDTDPGWYLEIVWAALQGTLERSSTSHCSRVRAAIVRLSSVPEFLRAARVGLRSPRTLSCEAAIERLAAILRFCRSRVEPLAENCRVPSLQADLAQADSLAVHALEDFGRAIREEMLPRATPEFSLGRESLDRMVSLCGFDSLSLEGVRERARSELAGHEALLDASVRTLSRSYAWTVVDSLERAEVEASQQVGYLRSTLDHARHYVRDQQLLTPPDPDVLDIRESSPTLGAPCIDLYVPGPWEPKVLDPRLELRVDDAGCLRDLGRMTAPVALVEDVIPGRLYYRLLGRRAGSRLRQALPMEAAAAAWGRYVAREMIEHGFMGSQAGFRIAFLARVCRQRARLLAEIGLHDGTMGLAEATTWLQGQGHLSPAEARTTAQGAALHPTEIESTLREWGLIDLRSDVEKRLASRFRPRHFHDAILAQGGLPPRALRAAVLREVGLTH